MKKQSGESGKPREALLNVFNKYPGNRGDLIPILQDIQEVEGYISREAMGQVAYFLNVPESVVYGVVTFYAQFYLTRQGRHKVKVCQGTACHVRGGVEIMKAVRKKLGIAPGETTQDYLFSLERVACFGSCALGPVVVVNDKVHGRMTPAKAEKLLEKLE